MKIKFVSYDGRYPNLCSGKLTLKIDDKEVTFGYHGNYPSFWCSGGRVCADKDWNFTVESGPWEFSDIRDLPDFLKGHEQELINIFNDNVGWGCCGGCV